VDIQGATGLLFFVPNWLYEALSLDGTVRKEENAMFILKELDELYDRFSSKANAPNLLDGKTKELIALACSVMVDCVPCIEYHHGRAVECGATEDEIKDTLGITMSIAAGSKRAKYGGLLSDLNAKIKKDARAR
jgi:AhpD family alkylhydroperoxidase